MSGHERVLMVSVGLSPQVVTETLHALHEAGEPLPDRIRLLTTRMGRGKIEETLLDAQAGKLAAWAREWDAAEPAELLRRVEVLEIDSDSGDVDEARALARFTRSAAEAVQAVTGREGTALHVSIAGGRKTSSAILAVLMAIFGRPQDRLTHVLVRPETAVASDFFFPTRAPHKLVVANETVDTSKVRILLQDLPVAGLVDGRCGAAAGEALARRLGAILDRPRLEIDLRRGRLLWDGRPHEWPPQRLALLALLARDLVEGGEGIARVGTPRARLLPFLSLHPRRGQEPKDDPLDPAWLEEKVSRINKLAAGCGITPGGGDLVVRDGPYARTRYRLALDPTEVAVRDAADGSNQPVRG